MTNRRRFLKDITVAGAAFAAFPHVSCTTAPKYKPVRTAPMGQMDETRLRLAFVGTGLMGGQNMKIFKTLGQELTAYCDVDKKYGYDTAKRYVDDKALAFTDYREMFDKLQGKVDGVVISTPDHSHFSIAISALKYGFPIYLEKPMCHNVWQIRELTRFAAEKGLPTQMGNFVHSGEGIRTTKEWIAGGLIGKVRKVVIWTCRPLTGVNRPAMEYKQWPSEPVPPHLDWDKWLNTAEYGPYSSEIVPLNWRRVYKYGTGSLGDIGTHIIDVPMYALGLDYPSKITSRQRGGTEISVPKQDHVTYYFDKSNQGVPVELHWYSGFSKKYDSNQGRFKDYDKSFLPPLPEEFTSLGKSWKDLSTEDGMFIIGDEGVLYAPKMHLIGKPVILPKSRAALANEIAKTETRIRNGDHRLNFLDAIRGNVPQATSDFSNVAKLTEVVMLGNMSLRANEDVIWDAKKMTCVGGSAKLNSYINTPMRPGWY